MDDVVDCRLSLGEMGLKSRRDEVVRLGEAICPDWLVSEKYRHMQDLAELRADNCNFFDAHPGNRIYLKVLEY